MNPKVRRLLALLILGPGLTFSLLSLLAAHSLTGNLFWPQRVHAAGPRYVAPAPAGSDGGNDCLNNATPCATVQHAVDQAGPGDEIRVAAGVYTGVFTRVSVLLAPAVVTQAVYISKPLSIRGGYTTTDWSTADPVARPTILDAQGLGRVFNLEAPDITTPIRVTLEGLHLTNGDATGQVAALGGPFGAGGGLHGAAITATFRNNRISNNNGGLIGGGVALVGGTATLVNNQITTNTVAFTGASTFGGGVVVAIPGAAGVARLSNNIIQGNIATTSGSAQNANGGGLYLMVAAVTMTNNLIQANTVAGLNGATGRGGGVNFSSSTIVTMTNPVVADNQIAGPGVGAGLLVETGEVHVLHPTIARNSGGDGSGVHVLAGTVALTNGILAGHTWGITAAAGSVATLDGVLWFDNSGGNTAGLGTISPNNEFTGDPAFAADGYHLEPGSAAIDRGVSTGFTTDIDGQSRQSSFPDLGADEAAYALRLTSTSSANPVQAGQPLTYTLTVSNTGAAGMTGVVLTDGLDSRISFASASQGGLHDAGLVTWNVGVIPVGQYLTRTLQVTVGNVVSGAILTNMVWLASNEGLTASETITHLVFTSPVAMPSLSLLKSGSPNPAQAGRELTYTLIVSNTGSVDLTHVMMTDTLDSQVSFVSASGDGLLDARQVTWQLGDIPIGQGISRTLAVTVGQVVSGTLLTNTAWATAAQGVGANAVITTQVVTAPLTTPQPVIYLPLILKSVISNR